jgi:hypothetical protein
VQLRQQLQMTRKASANRLLLQKESSKYTTRTSRLSVSKSFVLEDIVEAMVLGINKHVTRLKQNGRLSMTERCLRLLGNDLRV